jgi:hypothetical protein
MQKRDKLAIINVKEVNTQLEDAQITQYVQQKCHSADITKFEMVFLPMNQD